MRSSSLGKSATALLGVLLAWRVASRADRAADAGGGGAHDVRLGQGEIGAEPVRQRAWRDRAPVIVTAPDGSRRSVAVPRSSSRREPVAQAIEHGLLAEAVVAEARRAQEQRELAARIVSESRGHQARARVRHRGWASAAGALAASGAGLAATLWALLHPVETVAWVAAGGGVLVAFVARMAHGRAHPRSPRPGAAEADPA